MIAWGTDPVLSSARVANVHENGIRVLRLSTKIDHRATAGSRRGSSYYIEETQRG